MLCLAAVYGAHTVLRQDNPIAVFGGAQAPAEAAPGPICMVYFFHTPGQCSSVTEGTACNHCHRFADDAALMRRLGVKIRQAVRAGLIRQVQTFPDRKNAAK